MGKKVRFISTSKSANELDILDELMSLMMSDLNSIRKDKFKDFINREAIVGQGGQFPIVKVFTKSIAFPWKQEEQSIK